MMMATTLEQNPELLNQYEENYESSKVVQILRFLKDQERYTAERRAQAARPPAYVRLDERTEQERRRDGFRPRTADSAMFAPNYRPPRGRSSERPGTESPALSKARTNALTVSKIRGAANPGRPKLSRTPREQLDFSPVRENSRATIAVRPATQQATRVYRNDLRARLYSHPPPTRHELMKDKHLLEKRQSLLNRPKMTLDGGGDLLKSDTGNAIVQYDNNVVSVRLSRSTARLDHESRGGVEETPENVTRDVRSNTKSDSAGTGLRTLSASTEFSAEPAAVPNRKCPISIDDRPERSPVRSPDRTLVGANSSLAQRKPLQFAGTDSSGSGGGRVDVYHLPRLGHGVTMGGERAQPQPLPYLVETNSLS
ncbi:uncharacterized protein LOC118419469 [Branchiostoma floridae]|uniref:Uncharacterized protein LOC118419469 n=1 Tax=Branchiostoma floridae TaxID=7739 RepID=A0A9J7LF50_BRAFL|nr:uncharacterized protein LOC118419469 [Branchiostoma floridae]XP_035681755.1 uncharacterized protein LOC118419469 [Branchiostoma floridae]